MPKSNLTFNIALFAVAFFICLLVALLMVQGEGSRAPAPPGAGMPQQTGRVTVPGARQGSKADGALGLAYDPLAATPRVRVEADVEPGMQTTPAAPAGPDDLQIPNTGQPASPATEQPPAGLAASAAAALPAGQPAIASITPAGRPGARGTPELPDIAVPEGMATPRPAATATPNVMQRARNIPRDLIQTPLPVQSNQTGNPLDNRVAPRSATDAGTFPRWGTDTNPAILANPDKGETASFLPPAGPPPAVPGSTSELPVELPEPSRVRSATPSLLDARQPPRPTQFAAPTTPATPPISSAATLPVSTPALYAPHPSPTDPPSSDFDISAALQSTPSVQSPPPAMELPPIEPTPKTRSTNAGRETGEPHAPAPPDKEPTYTPIPTPAVVTVRQGGTEVTFSNVKSPLRTTPAPGAPGSTPATPDSVRQAITESLKQPGSAAPSASPATPAPRVQWVAPPPDAAGKPTSALPTPAPGVKFEPGPATAPGVLSNAAAMPSPTPTGEETDPEAIAALARGDAKDGPKLSPEQIAKLPPELQSRVGALKRKSGAQVGERLLSQEDVEKRVKAAVIIKGGGDLNESERVKLEGYLTRDWVQKTAIATEARRQGVQINDADIQKYRQKLAQRIGPNYEQVFRKAGLGDAEIQQEISDSTLVEKMVDIAYTKSVDDKKLREVYEASPDMFTPSRRLKVSEIYKAAPTGGDASAAQKEIESLKQRAAGGEDFAKLAQSASDAPSRERGGDIGWIDASTPIGPEVLQALSSLKPGQVSPVVKSASGWRVLKLEEVQEPKPGLDGAKENVEVHLRKFLKDAAYRTALEHTKVIIDGDAQTADGSGTARVRQSGQGSATARRTAASGPPPAAAGARTASPAPQEAPPGFGPALGRR